MKFPLELYTSERFPAGMPVLLYAGTCPRCRFLARCVAILSMGRVKTVPLAVPQWRQLYDGVLPKARGYTVLVLEEGPVYGPRVFAMVPLVVFRGWIRQCLSGFVRRSVAAERQQH